MLAACTTLGGGTGCATWTAGSVPRAGANPAVTYDRPVRLRFTNGNAVVLTHARVMSDSIVGEVEDAGTPPQRFASALRDVRGLDQQQVGTGLNFSLAIIPVITLFALVVVVADQTQKHPIP